MRLALSGLVLILLASPAGADGRPRPSAADLAKAVRHLKNGDEFHRPASGTPEEAELGRRLFADKRLSADGTMSCATCHDPAKRFADGRRTARGRGGKRLARNTPSLLTARYYSRLLWDGRLSTLQAAAARAIQSPDEMNEPLPALVRRLAGLTDYQDAFEAGVSTRAVEDALAAYVETLELPEDSPFDRFLASGKGLSPAAERGFLLFAGKANCVACHGSRSLRYDGRFVSTGLSASHPPDPGRYAVSPLRGNWEAFRVPSLRNVALTAPYMHDGRLSTLRDVIDFYSRGGDATRQKDGDVKRLDLTQGEKDDLLAFLGSLTSLSAVPDAVAEAP